MGGIVILGVFVADVAFQAKRQPKIGETLFGSRFALGPGGKGSNQAVAAARLGSDVSFLSRLGDDEFGRMARSLWKNEGIRPLAASDPDDPTGAAYIYVDEQTGDNAIIVVPGAAGNICITDLESHRDAISGASLFMTQLETSVETAHHGLEIARTSGVTTILNPAPAAPIGAETLALCDYLIPNETETEALTGAGIKSVGDAAAAAAALRDLSGGTAIITLGENGAFFDDGRRQCHIEAFNFGKTVETTGAGDSFCGALAHALTQGFEPIEASRFACAAASISVTRHGTAPAMPTAAEMKGFFRT
ncbi:MAG: ribokinase [Rhodobacteraceae bacterium]|nr:ribokinase [Paracoccaceae bacterium]